MLIGGFSAYSRVIDWARMREIADSVDAWFLVDMAHVAGLIAAGTDRVALDAVGLAILKNLGSNRAIMDTPIYEQEQIKRAAELKLGAPSPEYIQLVPAPGSEEAATIIRGILNRG